MMLGLARRLREKGVLGINRRNAEYILIYNQRRSYPLVDDKLLTKKLAESAGVAVPPLYAVIEYPHQARRIGEILAPYPDFAFKPAQGSQGEGILVVTERTKGFYRLANGTLIDDEDLAFHANNTLSGTYSLGGQPDKALVEYRVRLDPLFAPISYGGIPDIRIVVFLGVPVMAMVRLPTRTSGGRANLHQGAVGAGIDIATGRTLGGVLRDRIVDDHPDTGNAVAGTVIPYWDGLLGLAARSFEMTGLGYQGIDIVLDKDKGPLILELNARPGLGVQIANKAGLHRRLVAVQENIDRLPGAEERVAFAKERFGAAT